MADTAASGATPISRASRSATSIQASMAPTRMGTYQWRGARSSTSQVSSSGAWVPMWSGWKTRMNTPGPSWGAIMIPAAMSIRTMPSRPVARPRASIAPVSTTSV